MSRSSGVRRTSGHGACVDQDNRELGDVPMPCSRCGAIRSLGRAHGVLGRPAVALLDQVEAADGVCVAVETDTPLTAVHAPRTRVRRVSRRCSDRPRGCPATPPTPSHDLAGGSASSLRVPGRQVFGQTGTNRVPTLVACAIRPGMRAAGCGTHSCSCRARHPIRRWPHHGPARASDPTTSGGRTEPDRPLGPAHISARAATMSASTTSEARSASILVTNPRSERRVTTGSTDSR